MHDDQKQESSPSHADPPDSIRVRDATEGDVERIREIYQATYGKDYAFPEYYNVDYLKKMVFADDTVLMVAEDTSTADILGTASVLLDVGAFADLVGEFGRLAVHPDGRHRGIGNLLMRCRVERVQQRLHLGLVDNRTAHKFSQKISLRHGFVPVGLMPMKLLLKDRESVALFAKHFDESIELRRNHPRMIPEAYALAEVAMENCGVAPDPIVDDESAPYALHDGYEISELTTQGYATLLRFERGRVSHREIFGPVQLHYGLFKMQATHSTYLLAKRRGKVAGAVGFTADPVEKTLRVIEVVSASDEPIRFLLDDLVQRCRTDWGIEYIEIDVSAHAPRMQRTLLELGFLPAAYVPAMVFHTVERLDAIKMVRLLVPFKRRAASIVDAARPIVDVVADMFECQSIEPRVVAAAGTLGLFHQLSDEQGRQVARICQLVTFKPGETIFNAADIDGKTYVLLSGQVDVSLGAGHEHVGSIGAGECLGEMSLLRSAPHSATATAKTSAELAAFSSEDVEQLIRRRPDIGVVLYRNLAVGMGQKLWRADKIQKS